MSREDVLLKEYETCQQAVNTNMSRYWTVVSIFIGINAVFLGGITYYISIYLHQNVEWLVLSILVTMVGGATIYIIFRLKCWIKRVNWLISVKYFRMREIEIVLGMRANLIVDAVDHYWNELSPKQQQGIQSLHQSHVRPYETLQLTNIYWTLISLWGVLIIVTWLLPLIKDLFN
jgi:hypothetical protein